MIISDFTADNLGSPDAYTVQDSCRRVLIREKDRSAVTLATFNVYPPTGTGYRPCEGGEEFVYDPGRQIAIGEKLRIETVNVGSAVLSIIEAQ